MEHQTFKPRELHSAVPRVSIVYDSSSPPVMDPRATRPVTFMNELRFPKRSFHIAADRSRTNPFVLRLVRRRVDDAIIKVRLRPLDGSNGSRSPADVVADDEHQPYCIIIESVPQMRIIFRLQKPVRVLSSVRNKMEGTSNGRSTRFRTARP